MRLATFMFFAALVGADPAVEASAGAVVETYVLEPQWTLSADDGHEIVLPTVNFYPREMIGVTVDGDGAAYFCDAITQKLIKVSPDGSVAFAIGTFGEGPEDHGPIGEPVLCGADAIAWADLGTVYPKTILYRGDGAFVRSWKLGMDGELSRLFWSQDHWVAVASRNRIDSGKVFISSSLLVLDSKGRIVADRIMREVTWDPTKRIANEEDFYNVPRIAVSGDGFIFVQRDLYSTRVECLDLSLRLLWEFDAPWPKIERLKDEAADVRVTGPGTVVPSKYRQSIRRIVARNNGEAWLQAMPGDADAAASGAFRVFGRDGTDLGEVRLEGLPGEPGDFVVNGDKLLWMPVDSEEAGRGATHGARVFSLLAKTR